MRLRTATLLLLTCSILFSAGPRPRVVRAQETSGGVDVVRAAYDDLFSLFYKPLDATTLLKAGWSALGRAASQRGLSAPPALPALPSGQDEAFSAFASAYSTYLAGASATDLGNELGFDIANGMVASVGESHTNFLRPPSYRSFLASLGAGSLQVSLGIRTTGSAPWIVTAVAPGSPAEAGGLRPGDQIMMSDGVDLTAADSQQFMRSTGGAEGTSHTLRVGRASGPLDLTITRGAYYFPPLTSKLLPGGAGYVALEHFPDAGLTLPDGTEIVSEFHRQLNDLIAQGASGLVLDLRGNGGGDTLAAEEILGSFLPPDSKTVVRFDERGHAATGVVAGPMLPAQLPLVVLVNGNSASSSEVVASTLREAGRALLVGERTAGALATSEVVPLPNGAGLQVAVAEQVTARGNIRIDGNGFPVDVEVPDSRTADDYRSGRDPQLQAAIDALPAAPAPPPVVVPNRPSKEQIGALLSSYAPDPAQIPTNDRLSSVVRTETLNLNHPDEWLDTFGFGGRDPAMLEQRLQQRGWIGSHVQNYNTQALIPPSVSVVIDLYASAAGAEDALRTNDFPDQQELTQTPIQLGDDTVAARGIWLDLGGLSLSWRRGNVVLNVGYGDVPGFERMDTLVEIAKVVDQAFTAQPPPSLPAASLAGPVDAMASATMGLAEPGHGAAVAGGEYDARARWFAHPRPHTV